MKKINATQVQNPCCDCAEAAILVSHTLETCRMLLRTCCEDQQPKSVSGLVALTTGYEEIKIGTPGEPVEVYLSVSSLDPQVCAAEVDMTGTRLLPDGFVLYANVKSSEVQIKWVAYLS